MAGMIPVEMLGFTEFPTIGKLSYRLTLGPYAFFWFELQGTPDSRAVGGSTETEATGVVIALANAAALFEPSTRRALEHTILPKYLPKQRWFGAKARVIESTRIVDWIWLRQEMPASALVFLEVNYAGDGAELYQAPLSLTVGRQAEELLQARPEAVLCDIRLGESAGVLHDALADDEACLALLQAVEKRQTLQGHSGRAEASPTRVLAEILTDAAPLKVVRSSAEQSNSSVAFGGKVMLKLFRRLEDGPNPDVEITRYLTEESPFPAIPPLAGYIDFLSPAGQGSTLAMLQRVVPHQGDGWKKTLDELARYYELCSTFRELPEEVRQDNESLLDLAAKETPKAARDRIGIYLDSAATLGRRTAQMHLALAASSTNPSFQPETLSRSDLQTMAFALRDRATHAFHSLRASLPNLPDEIMDRAALALGQRGRILRRFQALEQIDPEIVRIRIHGDYHLGQVLWVENDFVIVDFEGEPARPLAERRLKQPALKDVAGMLRSFSYAAYAGLLSYTARRPEEFGQLEPWAAFWEKWSSVAFLHAYLETAPDSRILPPDSARLEVLLDAFLLDKALYELTYELNNRPAWVRIPLRGILNLAR